MHNDSLPPSDRDTARSTFPHDGEIRAQLIAFRDDSGGDWSNSAIAKRLGYSTRVISDYLAPAGNHYDGDTLAVEKKIKEFLRDRRMVSDSSVETIPCEISRKVESSLECIRTSLRIGVIIGEPGIGKTRAVKLYTDSHELAISFTAWEGACSKSALVDLLFSAANVARAKRGDNKIQLLADRLCDSGRLIIADDAHKLSPHALQLLYDFRDRARTPVALVGDDRLIAKLQSDRQRLRRTGEVTELEVKNSTPLIEHHIDQLLDAKSIREERSDIIALCKEIATRDGVFGSVQTELSLAVTIKTAKPDISWAEAIHSAHKRLIRKTPLTAN